MEAKPPHASPTRLARGGGGGRPESAGMGGRAAAARSERGVKALHDGFQNLHTGELFVVARDNRPRGELRAAPGGHLIDDALVVGPFFPVPPVLVGDFVALV